MAQYSWQIPREKECALGVQEDILKHSGTSFNELLKGRNLVSLCASLELLLEDGKVGMKITRGLDDFQDAQKFFPIHQ